MSTDIIPFDPKGTLKNLPAHMAGDQGIESNLTARISINQLSFRGKLFRTVIDGKEEQLLRPDPDSNEMVPAQMINVVVLGQNSKRSRAYYEGKFEEGKNAAPVCFSGDGVKPDSDVKTPCASTCAACPKAVKGSKVSDDSDAKLTACSTYKRIAIVPAGTISTHVPLLLRIPQTSMWDKDNAQASNGWYAYDQFIDMLRAKGVDHTAKLNTRIKFDTSATHPKLLFSADRWLNADEWAAALVKMKDNKDEIDGIIYGKQSHDGMTGQPAADDGETFEQAAGDAGAAASAEAANRAAAAQKATEAAAVKAATEAAAEKRRKAEALKAQLAALEADETPAAAAPEASKPVVAAPAPTPAPAKEAKAAAPVVEVIESGTPTGLANLIADWDK